LTDFRTFPYNFHPKNERTGDLENIKYNLFERTEPVVLPEQLGFGKYFTDNVFVMDYTPAKGWHNPQITSLASLQMHPATSVLHYGQTIFEGLKAYYTPDGEYQLFRPEENFKRMNNSARRLCMPEVDVDYCVDALKELVWIERNWIPRGESDSLYVRPFMYGDDPVLGVKPSDTYKFILLLSPVGAYYPEGFKPVKILIQDEYVRTVRKGLGECKTAGNYAASLIGQEIAKKEGCTQTLWLDAVELKYIEEVGTMNIFVQFNDEVATPQLTGGILPGITRKSAIQILRDWGYKVSERQVSLDELLTRYAKGEVLEVFGTGTAAIISSVCELKYKDKSLVFCDRQVGKLAERLFKELTGIQKGILPDRFGWTTKVEPVSVTA